MALAHSPHHPPSPPLPTAQLPAQRPHRYQRLMPSVGSILQRSWSAQIMKRQPSGEMALPPAWPAGWQVGARRGGRGCGLRPFNLRHSCFTPTRVRPTHPPPHNLPSTHPPTPSCHANHPPSHSCLPCNHPPTLQPTHLARSRPACPSPQLGSRSTAHTLHCSPRQGLPPAGHRGPCACRRSPCRAARTTGKRTLGWLQATCGRLEARRCSALFVRCAAGVSEPQLQELDQLTGTHHCSL